MKRIIPRVKKIILPVLFLRFFVFIIAIASFVFLSTVAVHELGHALAAQYYGCEQSKAVIYDIAGPPHTDIMCDSYYNDNVITLAGITLTLSLGLIFFLTGGQFTTIMSILILGYSLLISYGDLNELGISMNIIVVVMSLAFILIIGGVIRLSGYYIKQQKGFYNINKGADINPENYFWLDDDEAIKNLYELVCALHNMGDMTFKEYVNKDKNDFSIWIRDIFKDENLADQISKTTDRKETLSLVLVSLLREQKH